MNKKPFWTPNRLYACISAAFVLGLIVASLAFICAGMKQRISQTDAIELATYRMLKELFTLNKHQNYEHSKAYSRTVGNPG